MSNVHVYIGNDDFLIAETVKKFFGGDVGVDVIDSRNSSNEDLRLHDIAQASISLATPPFLEPRKVTWWKNVEYLPGGSSKKGDSGEKKNAASEAVKEAMARFVDRLAATQLPDNQHFVISASHLLKTSLIAKKLMTFAEVVVFGDGKPSEVTRQVEMRVVELAAESGLKFEDGATASLFVAKVGTDTRSLVSEIAKMREYLGEYDHTITADAINAITSSGVGVEPTFWDLTDAIGYRNLEKALIATAAFEGMSGFEIVFTAVVEKFFRQLLDVAAGKTDGMAPFVIRKMKGFLNNWKVNELRIARWRFLMLREKVVSGLESGSDVAVTELVRAIRR